MSFGLMLCFGMSVGVEVVERWCGVYVIVRLMIFVYTVPIGCLTCSFQGVQNKGVSTERWLEAKDVYEGGEAGLVVRGESRL